MFDSTNMQLYSP